MLWLEGSIDELGLTLGCRARSTSVGSETGEDRGGALPEGHGEEGARLVSPQPGESRSSYGDRLGTGEEEGGPGSGQQPRWTGGPVPWPGVLPPRRLLSQCQPLRRVAGDYGDSAVLMSLPSFIKRPNQRVSQAHAVLFTATIISPT